MNLVVRAARDEDADQMAAILNEIVSIGGLTSREGPFDGGRIRREFISPPRGISCFVAAAGSDVKGFQSLEWSDPDWPGEDRLPADWAFISTYVNPAIAALASERLCSREPSPLPTLQVSASSTPASGSRMPARWPSMTASASKTTGASPTRCRSASLRGDADVRHLPLPADGLEALADIRAIELSLIRASAQEATGRHGRVAGPCWS
jgi:hypothetical protein